MESQFCEYEISGADQTAEVVTGAGNASLTPGRVFHRDNWYTRLVHKAVNISFSGPN